MPILRKQITPVLILVFFLLFSESIAQKTIHVFKLNAPAKIDGVFETELWAGADSVSNFVQMEPQTGEAASEKTVVYLGLHNDKLYVVFNCYQSTPVIAKNQSRDALSKDDDIIALILDTYKDNRSGYTFLTNPLGTQYDLKINDDGRNEDTNWDTEWKCS